MNYDSLTLYLCKISVRTGISGRETYEIEISENWWMSKIRGSIFST